MVVKFNISKINLCFVFRNKWDAKSKETFYDTSFKRYSLGVWYRLNKVVSSSCISDPNKWNDNIINSHMIGVDLLVFKFWVSIKRII